MKKNDWLIVIATIAYTCLFYHQFAGLNFLLLNILLVGSCLFRKPELVKSPAWIASATGALITSFAVFYLGTGFSIFANIISLALLAALSFNPNNSLFIAFFNTINSYALTVPLMIVHGLSLNSSRESKGRVRSRKIILFAGAVCVAFIFFFLYRAANPVFEKITDQINFDWISVDWLFFTFIGFVLMYAFFRHQVVKDWSDTDEKSSDALTYVSEEDHAKSFFAEFISLPNEMFTGVLILVLLNILLFSVNAIDVSYIYILNQLPKGMSFSEYVHDGTEALIFSIILAINIILFYFRGRLNFVENNRVLKTLSYAWIIQNIFLVITTGNRNYFYVSSFGLTYERIGVYVFLALTIAGFVTTFIRVAYTKSNWFLFRKNVWVVYICLVASSVINWASLVASYNLNLAIEKKVTCDVYYLADLGYTALPVMVDYYSKCGVEDKAKIFDPYLLSQMKQQYTELKNESEVSGWQSACLTKTEARQKAAAIFTAH